MAQIVDAELLANIIQQLNVKGALAPFEIGQTAVPVFDIGRLTALDVPTRVGAAAAFHLNVGREALSPAGNDSTGLTNPLDAAVMADTGPLAAGIWMIDAHYAQDAGLVETARFAWRNAANAVDLAEWIFATSVPVQKGPLFVDVSANERFRWQQVGNSGADVFTSISFVLTAPSIA